MKQALTGAIFGAIFFSIDWIQEGDRHLLSDVHSLGLLAGMVIGGAALYVLITHSGLRKNDK